MIKFTENSYIIEVKFPHRPEENYANTVEELLSMLQRKSEDNTDNYYFVLELLQAMMPDLNSLKKINKDC